MTMMPSGDDDEVWERLKRQLSAAGRVTLTESFQPVSKDRHAVVPGFTKRQIALMAAFFVNVCEGNSYKAIAYARRFEKTCDDRLLGRAVRVAVEKKLEA